MKKIIPFLGLSIILGLSSCNEESRLANSINGEWTGTPETFTDNTSITSSVIDTYVIMPDTSDIRGQYAGPMIITGMITSTTQIVGDSSLIEPLSLTAAAKSTITGSWSVIDDDELAVNLDPSSLTIEVDPSAIVVNTNMIGKSPNPSIDSIKPALCATIERGLRQALVNRYASIRHLDDVKVKGSLLKFEIGKTDYVLTRQTSD